MSLTVGVTSLQTNTTPRCDKINMFLDSPVLLFCCITPDAFCEITSLCRLCDGWPVAGGAPCVCCVP